MAPKQDPIDEVQWFDPISFEQQFGGLLHSNNVHFYFANSPFFDPTSNNAILISQGHRNMALGQHVLTTREAFEARLRTMAGLEYMVAEAPENPMYGTGVWVFNKQTRTKIPDMEDEITVLATYFIVGIHIYQAPTFADIMASRMAAINYHLSKTLSPAKKSLKWTPATGHFYLKPETASASSPDKPQQQQQQQKRIDHQIQSCPAAEPTSSILNPETSNPPSTTSGISSPSSLLLEESLLAHLKYGQEYMDENPITGQPGNFHLSSTGRVADPVTKVAQQHQGPAGKLVPVLSTYSAADGTADGLASLLAKKDAGAAKEPGATEKASKASSRTGAATGAAAAPAAVQKIKRRKSKVLPAAAPALAGASSAATGA